ncbi:uncharacterized protein LOC128232999 [Mya arenaria]|uniref:uncharacterized protein LOC128232999 n=1 Tax=Mya arenaria TaxID=6604 RepID=UPI0022DF54FA|nr:uncharacterized protein LOC128232999 [Mya arenaria]
MNKYVLVVVLATVFALGESMVCFKGICDHIEKTDLVCKGSVIKNGGFCGCNDVCSKQEGESCQAELIRGRIPLGKCDTGLQCQHQEHMMIGVGKCVKDGNKSKREQTECQRQRIRSMIVMIVYRGQWFPKCDVEGLFMPEQCNNINECFCVDVQTGVIDESTRTVGSANCETNQSATTIAP